MARAVIVAEADTGEVRALVEALCESFFQHQERQGSMRLVDVLMGVQNFYAYMLRSLAGAQELSERERGLFYRMALDTLEAGLTNGH